MELDKIYAHYLEAPLISTDTRKIEKNSIFFALKGVHFNGNSFAKKAIELGAKIAIVDEKEFENQAIGVYWVENALATLQDLATLHRKKLNLHLIGLTGSNGKTTSKELIASVLKQKFKTFCTQGNLNNHIGVPLSLLSLHNKHEIAVIEMGANHQKEIEQLAAICLPDIGYITNFGKAHLEGFGGVEGVIKGKSELYENLKNNHKKVLVNAADELQVKQAKDISDKITFGTKEADYFIELGHSQSNFLVVKYKETTIQTNLTGAYNFSNVSAAIALGLYFSLPIEKIKKGIEDYFPDNMRSQILKKANKQIVLDTYNANPSSMEVALINFSEFSGTKTVILGDMFELGNNELDEHQSIVNKAIDLKFDWILLVGERFYETTNEKNKSIYKFKSREELFDFLISTKLSQNILIKGSRGMALEKILDYL
jgi:UDP-N-acetylmuramoyl-tripeptide--D-alanyl-D-alanine ligase